MGKRNCPGKALAIRIMLITVSKLIKKYRFKRNENQQTIVIEKRIYNQK